LPVQKIKNSGVKKQKSYRVTGGNQKNSGVKKQKNHRNPKTESQGV